MMTRDVAYLDGKEISLEDLRKTLRKAVIAHTTCRVLCGSALKNKACSSCGCRRRLSTLPRFAAGKRS